LIGFGKQLVLPLNPRRFRLDICPLKGQSKFGEMAGFHDGCRRGFAASLACSNGLTNWKKSMRKSALWYPRFTIDKCLARC